MNYTELIYCITNVVRLYVIYKLFHIFFPEFRYGKVGELIAYASFYIVNSFLYIYYCIPLITMFANIMPLFLIAFIYKGTLRRKVLAVAIAEVLNMCSEFIATIFLDSKWIEFNQNNEILSGLTYILEVLVFYFIMQILQKVLNVKSEVRVPVLFWVQLVILVIISGVLIFIVYIEHISRWANFICVISVLSVNVIAIMLYDPVIKQMNEKIDTTRIVEINRSYEKQFELLESNIEQTRILRHDIKNHISALHHMINAGEISKANIYMDELLDDANISKSYVSTGNTQLDAIMNYKCTQADNKGIKVKIEASISKNIQLDSKDFMTIFGNLMDNAIEAQEDMIDKRWIDITIKEGNNIYKIIV